MTRRRAPSFVEVACQDGRRFLIELPGAQLEAAVLAAIGIKPLKAKPALEPVERRFTRAGDEPVTPGQARAFRDAADAIREAVQ